MNEQSSRRLAPASYALALVITLTAVGVLLRWWGPMNPSIRVGVATENNAVSGSATSSMDIDWGADGKAKVTLNLDNGSRSAATLQQLRVVRSPESPDLPLPTLQVRTMATRLEPMQSLDLDVTLVAGKDCAAWITGLLKKPANIPSSSFSVVADLRTSSGRTKSVGHNIRLQDICPTDAFLPPPGLQPANPEAAKRAVTSAFWVAYDSSKGAKERAAAIDDMTGIPGASAPGGARSQVHDIVFTSPTTAAVVYDIYLDGTPAASGRLGRARLVDNTWKVTRSTICGDLDLAGLHCT